MLSEARKLISASIEGIGKDPRLLLFEDRKMARKQSCDAADMGAATRFALQWLGDHLRNLAFTAVRVVHGGSRYTAAVRLTPEVKRDIEAFRQLAPLHNSSSLAVLAILEKQLAQLPIAVAFDTAFHSTLPEVAWRYPIDRETADRFGLRKFGFHGLSHRYMLEHYARMVGKVPDDISIVTLHLESGSSAAIDHGRSIDTTMGLTPLEGLMMGTRSGSLDPAMVPYLMRRLNTTADEVLAFLNKKSGLLGIAGDTFDTRELVKRQDEAAQLALAMFSYRIRLAVGACLAALGHAEAVIFGGGIGEDTPLVREQVCAGLESLALDREANARSTSGQACITRPGSRIQAFVLPLEEGLQLAHACAHALGML